MTRRKHYRGMFERYLTARTAPRRIWQTVLALIILSGIYLLLPPAEITAARAWMEMVLGRLR